MMKQVKERVFVTKPEDGSAPASILGPTLHVVQSLQDEASQPMIIPISYSQLPPA